MRAANRDELAIDQRDALMGGHWQVIMRSSSCSLLGGLPRLSHSMPSTGGVSCGRLDPTVATVGGAVVGRKSSSVSAAIRGRGWIGAIRVAGRRRGS